KHQPPKPKAIATETATKKIWKAFKDILLRQNYVLRIWTALIGGAPRHLVARPNYQPHQRREEKGGGEQDGIDGLALGHQMHEVAGDEERFDASNKQRDHDRNFHA